MSRTAEALSQEEQAMARENWLKMPEDLRAFVVQLVERGLMDGRRGLAYSIVAIAPERLPREGVVPYIPSRAEREAIERARSRGVKR